MGREAAPFLAVFAVLLVLLHGWLWWRLVHGIALGPWVDGLGAFAFAAGVVGILGTLAPRLLRTRAVPGVSAVGYPWLGLVFLATWVTVATEPVRIALWAAGEADWAPVLSLVALGLVLALGIGGRIAAARPVLRRVTVPIEGLAPALRGLRIAQVSDLHVGPGIGRDFVQTVARRVEALSPDLVALTGDLVDGPVEELADALAPLLAVRAPLGTWFVIGNHELYAGAEAWCAHLASLGIHVLRNRHEVVEHQGARLVVAGVDDPFGRPGPDVGAALAGADPALPVLLLAHQPVTIDDAARAGVALQLSGHTHGGQIFPFGYAVRAAQPYLAGLVRHGPTWLYVHQGTGTWGPRMRVGTLGEIAVIELA
ncbi:MAG: metallophosphoesterase [Alphaproteobacteria bacterium]|nr:metallophosphoesterase [Alphaproteobacteria bacterium]MCB9695777.1 metallophosphoesterase [Alphaproteobacteria bacterium]